MKQTIRNKTTTAPTEYVDYLLIKHLYHCTPSELDEQDEFITDLHVEFMNLEAKEEALRLRRNEQKAKMKRVH